MISLKIFYSFFVLKIDFGRGESGLTATSTFVDYVRWHYYVIFYTFCEMLPIGLMVFFQWRFVVIFESKRTSFLIFNQI